MKFNLEGMKFNHLTVIGPAGTDGRQHRLWECKCDCGNTTLATTSDLRHGHKKSCGCLNRAPHANNLKGQQFGMLGRLNLADINTSKMKALYINLITEKGFKPITVDNVHTVLKDS